MQFSFVDFCQQQFLFNWIILLDYFESIQYPNPFTIFANSVLFIISHPRKYSLAITFVAAILTLSFPNFVPEWMILLVWVISLKNDPDFVELWMFLTFSIFESAVLEILFAGLTKRKLCHPYSKIWIIISLFVFKYVTLDFLSGSVLRVFPFADWVTGVIKKLSAESLWFYKLSHWRHYKNKQKIEKSMATSLQSSALFFKKPIILQKCLWDRVRLDFEM